MHKQEKLTYEFTFLYIDVDTLPKWFLEMDIHFLSIHCIADNERQYTA